MSDNGDASTPDRDSLQRALWHFVGTLAWALGIALVFAVVQWSVVATYVQWQEAAGPAPERNRLYEAAIRDGDVLAWATLASSLVCGAMTFWAGYRRAGRIGRNATAGLAPGIYLGMRLPSPGQLLRWLLGFIALLLVLDLLTTLLDRPVSPDVMREIYNSADNKVLLFVAVVVAASLFEELFFRGLLLEGFRRTLPGPWGAVLLTAGIWSLVHLQYDLLGMLTIFAIGVFLGVAKLKTGSVWLTAVLHGFNNTAAFLVLMYLS